jgi:hypothetical protein
MKRITVSSLVIMSLLAVCTLDDLLSLHDIRADYVSASVFRYLGIPFPAALPPWTATSLEWASITVSYILRSVLIAANLILLSILHRKLRSLSDIETK